MKDYNSYVIKGNEAGACAAPEPRTRAVNVRDLNRRKSASCGLACFGRSQPGQNIRHRRLSGLRPWTRNSGCCLMGITILVPAGAWRNAEVRLGAVVLLARRRSRQPGCFASGESRENPHKVFYFPWENASLWGTDLKKQLTERYIDLLFFILCQFLSCNQQIEDFQFFFG